MGAGLCYFVKLFVSHVQTRIAHMAIILLCCRHPTDAWSIVGTAMIRQTLIMVRMTGSHSDDADVSDDGGSRQLMR